MNGKLKAGTAFLFSFFLMTLFSGIAHSAPVPLETGKTSLNGEWLLAVTTAGDASTFDGFEAPMFDGSAMKPIPVPSNWEMYGFEKPRYAIPSDNVGFYRKDFEVPDMAPGEHLMLHFEGVQFGAKVWLNGELLGDHFSAFTPFEFDITDVVHTGRSNILAVKVTKSSELTHEFDSNDAWALSGIYRDVYLYRLPPQHLSVIQVETDFDDEYKDANLTMRMAVKNNSKESADTKVTATLLEPGGGSSVITFEKEINIQASEEAKFVLGGKVDKPRHWTAETPDLYTIRVTVESGEKIVSTTEQNIGFREVEIDGPRLLINGVPVKLRGVNRHEISIERGRALTTEDWMQDIKLMKEANINTVRTSHYPPDPEFIDLCDRYGFYVIDEVPFGYGDELHYMMSLHDNLKQRLFETVARDRNHPSVIIWSLGNENPWTIVYEKLTPIVKKLDKTRPVLTPRGGFENSGMGDVLPPEIDIFAPHYPSPEKLQAIIDHYAEKPRPVVMTEYLHALGRHWFTREIWDTVWDNEASAGGCVWLWADQGIRRDTTGEHVYTIEDHDVPSPHYTFTFLNGPEDRLDESHIIDTHGIYGKDGIVYSDRTPQADYYEIKKIYTPIYIEQDTATAEDNSKTVKLDIHNRYDFTNLKGLKYDWRLEIDYELISEGSGVYPDVAPHEKAVLSVDLGKPIPWIWGKKHILEIVSYGMDGKDDDKQQVELFSGVDVPEPEEEDEEKSWCEPMNEDAPTVDDLYIGNVDFGVRFDPEQGMIVEARTLDKSFVLRGPILNTWRPIQLVELSQPSFKDYKLLDQLKNLEPEVRTIETTGHGLTQSGVRAEVWYAFPDDPEKGFLVTYDYLVRCSGIIEIAYDIETHIGEEVPLLELGVYFELPLEYSDLELAGRGPDTYPYSIMNTEVSQLKKMSFKPGDRYYETNKYDIEWATLSGGDSAITFELPDPMEADIKHDFRNVRVVREEDSEKLFINPYVKHPRKKNGDPHYPLMRKFSDGDSVYGRVIVHLPMPDYDE